MAHPGYHKDIQSNSPDFEVKRAGKRHKCAGVAIERGARPGPLHDVWMLGRSRRCIETIRQGQLYVANKKLPPRIIDVLRDWFPLCLFCAIETYPEHFEGPLKVKYLAPLTPAKKARVLQGLAGILEDVENHRAREAA